MPESSAKYVLLGISGTLYDDAKVLFAAIEGGGVLTALPTPPRLHIFRAHGTCLAPVSTSDSDATEKMDILWPYTPGMQRPA